MGWGRARILLRVWRHVAAGALVGMVAMHAVLRSAGEARWVVVLALGAIAYLAVTDARRAKKLDAIGQAQRHEVEVAKRATRTVEHRFQTVFESHLVPLAISREDGRVVEANDAWLRLVGHTREELERGEITSEAINPPEWSQQYAEKVASVRERGRYGPVEKQYLRPDGGRVPALVGATAMPGEPGTFLAFAVDLSEQKRMEQALRDSEARLRRLWDSNIIGVIHSDARGAIFDANDFVLRMLGYDRADLEAGRIRWKDITPPAFLPLDDTGIAEALAHGACTPYEKAYVGKDGRVVPVLIGYALVDRARSEFICFVLDLTDQKRSEEQARAAAERALLLESERAARAAAERESHAKDEFVATLSHELRTPLNAILGFSHLAQRPGQAPEQLRHALEVIERNALLLTQLIADLLDVSRIVSGKLRVELAPMDLRAAIEAALAAVRPAAEEKGVALVAASGAKDATVRGDPARLQQVVWNLVSNALKFTPRGGRVDVALVLSEEEVRVEVGDTGQGIDPEFLPHVFERFRQAEGSASRRHGGLGLGLSIVKHLVEIHGGTVRATSEGPGRGARFTVTLPRIHAAAHEVAPARALALEGLAGARVLVVDDEPDARDLVRRLLEEHGAVVVTAASAAEALDALAAQRPDVMISDIGMPGVDGYDLIRRVRAGKAAPDVAAVALTAYARPEDRARALGAGYQAHLRKPVDPGEMLAVVAGLVAGAPVARAS